MTTLRRWLGNGNWRLLAVCTLLLTLGACGDGDDDGNPAGPSGSGSSSTTGSGGGSGGSSNTTGLRVTIDGVSFTPLTVTAVRSNPGIPTISIAAGSASGTAFAFLAPERVDTHRIASGSVTNANMTIVSGGNSAGYLAFGTSGSGSVTFSSITQTQVVGRVDLVLVATGTGPNKTLAGTFTLPLVN
jgi:hypothetical protein